jgi:putative nucleotidyltransferase with HDIG domain
MKKRILFVDDDPNILRGLKLMLHSRRKEWELDFALDGQRALELMEQKKFDAIVSDMRMPGMDGAQLLEHVRKLHPESARIILSGYSDLEASMKAVKPAQHYLMKPCTAKTLQDLLDRILHGPRDIDDPGLRELISGVESLPALPATYLRIVEELANPEPSIQKIGRLVEQDVAVSAMILKIVNSAYFGLLRKIASPSQAVALLGTEVVQGLVLGLHLFDSFDETKIKEMSLAKLWQHSLHTGYLAKSIAWQGNKDKALIDTAFITGMLHDLGKLLLVMNFTEQYQEIIKAAATQDTFIFQLEHEAFATSHAEVGAYLLQTWGLPEGLVEGVRNHHRLERVDDPASISVLIHAANCFDHELRTVAPDYAFAPLDAASLHRFGLDDRIGEWRGISEELQQKGEQ